MSVEFSIIIPTHNRPDLLPRAIASALAQAGTTSEVIIVDDGSEPAVSICRYSDNVFVYRSPCRSGPGAARNLAIEQAKGQWIVFLDDDDEMLPGCLSAIKHALLTHPEVQFCWSGVQYMNYDADVPYIAGERSFRSQFRDSEDMFVEALSIGTGFGLTIAAACFRDVGGFDPTFTITEDAELLIRLLSCGYRGVPVEGVWVRVHNHQGNRLTGAMFNSLRASQCELLLARYRKFVAQNLRVERQLLRQIDVLRASASTPNENFCVDALRTTSATTPSVSIQG